MNRERACGKLEMGLLSEGEKTKSGRFGGMGIVFFVDKGNWPHAGCHSWNAGDSGGSVVPPPLSSPSLKFERPYLRLNDHLSALQSSITEHEKALWMNGTIVHSQPRP